MSFRRKYHQLEREAIHAYSFLFFFLMIRLVKVSVDSAILISGSYMSNLRMYL